MRKRIEDRVKQLEGILVQRERELAEAQTRRDRVLGALEDMRFMIEGDDAEQALPVKDGQIKGSIPGKAEGTGGKS